MAGVSERIRVVRLDVEPKKISDVVGYFQDWMERFVFRQRPDTESCMYGRKANPFAVSADRARVLKEGLSFRCGPYFIFNPMERKDFIGVTRALEIAAQELFRSFGATEVRLSTIRNPSRDMDLKRSLLKAAGVYDFVTLDRENQLDGKVATTVGSLFHDQETVEAFTRNLRKARRDEHDANLRFAAWGDD